MLEADFHVPRAEFTLEARLAAAPGRLTVLAGENGAGKSTLLRALAGLVEPARGHARLGELVLFDRARHLRLAAEARPIGYVPQELSLFPHMTVEENVGFGLRAQGLAGRDVRSRTHAALERFGLAALASRRPASL
ncbi:MAG TPA: ATP-binding cassette domain-containing protein, partial [Candidatus Eisenbacteria bacterium]